MLIMISIIIINSLSLSHAHFGWNESKEMSKDNLLCGTWILVLRSLPIVKTAFAVKLALSLYIYICVCESLLVCLLLNISFGKLQAILWHVIYFVSGDFSFLLLLFLFFFHQWFKVNNFRGDRAMLEFGIFAQRLERCIHAPLFCCFNKFIALKEKCCSFFLFAWAQFISQTTKPPEWSRCTVLEIAFCAFKVLMTEQLQSEHIFKRSLNLPFAQK